MPSPRQIKRNHCTTTNLLRNWGTGALVRPKWKGHGRDANIETHENRFADMEKREERRMERDCQTIPTISDNGFEDNLDNWEQPFQGAGRTTPPGAKRTKGAAGERDGRVNIENHENRFADMDGGREADVQSGDGRPARGASGKRKTSGMTPSPLQKRGGARWKGKPRAGACGVDGPGGGVASAGAFAKPREVPPGPRARERIDSHPVLCRMPSNTMVWSCRSPADMPRGLRLADEQRGNHC